jgi:hypothetical protein
MLSTQAQNMKAKIKTLLKDGRWLEKMTSAELNFLANTNPDLCQEKKLDESGKIRSVIKPECRHRYKLYKLLRSQRRVPKNSHAEKILKTMKE